MSLWTGFVNVVLRGKNERETNIKLQWEGGKVGGWGGDLQCSQPESFQSAALQAVCFRQALVA